MLAVLRHAFNHYRAQILAWGLSVAALGLMLIPFYDTFLQEQETMSQLLESYPQELLAFFGMVAGDFFAPAGFLDTYLSFFPPLLGIFAISAGSALLAADEENGRLDLILAHPVGRTVLFFGRFLAFLGAALGVLFISWLGFCLPLGGSQMQLSWGEMALPFISLLAQVLVYGTLALLLSMLLPARRLSSMVTGLIMVASYFFTSLSSLNRDLKPIAQLLPHDYYQGGGAVEGLNMTWLLGLLGISLLFVLLAWWCFLRRDIRVGGEGGWQIPRLRRLFRSKA